MALPETGMPAPAPPGSSFPSSDTYTSSYIIDHHRPVAFWHKLFVRCLARSSQWGHSRLRPRTQSVSRRQRRHQMRQERSRSRPNHRRAAVRVTVLPHTAAVKCKNCGRATIAALPVRAVFPATSCPFKVCSLDCGLLFHASWTAIEAEALDEPGESVVVRPASSGV